MPLQPCRVALYPRISGQVGKVEKVHNLRYNDTIRVSEMWYPNGCEGVCCRVCTWRTYNTGSGVEFIYRKGGPEGVEVLSVYPYGHIFRPGNEFTPKVRIRVTGFTLSESRGDHLNNLDGNTYSTWLVQSVRGEGISEYEFVFSPNMRAPDASGSYVSKWRLRVGGEYKGPEITIAFSVESQDPTPTPADWQVEYFNDKELNSRCDTGGYNGVYVFKGWGDGSPASGCNSNHWSARFKRRMHFQSGDYTFALFADDWGRIKVNGSVVVNQWAGATQHYEGRYLSTGDYDIEIEFADTEGAAKLSAWWWGPSYPVPRESRDPNQWYAEYWGHKDLWWDSVVRRNEGYGFLIHEWGMGGPGYGLPNDGFSSRFERRAQFDCGRHRFRILSDDGVRFWIDGQPRLDRWYDGVHNQEILVDLASGPHDLKVEHYENGGAAAIKLEWFLESACATPTPTQIPTPSQTPTRTPVPDSEPPTLEWLQPVGNGEVYNVGDETVLLEVSATDNVGVDHVSFWRWDAVNLVWVHLGDIESAPYRMDLDCRTLNYEWNYAVAVAFDTSGNTTERHIWLYRSRPTPTPTQTTTPSCPGADAGGSFHSATVASLPASITEYICPAEDEDWYRFSVSAGQTIHISLSNLPGDYDLYLYRPDGSHAACSYWGGTVSEHISYTADSSGDWRVRVVGYSGAYSASHPYLLTISGSISQLYLPLVAR